MSKFFAEDNPFNALLTKVFDLCVLNMVTLLCCVPIVTAGASLTAMYAVMLPMSEDKEGPIVKSFFKQFRSNLKGSVKTWLVILLAAVVLSFDLYVWTKVESQYRSVFFGLTLAMLIALAVVASWYFGLRATFEDTGKTSLINAGKYTLIYLPISALMGIYTAAIIYVYLQQGFVALLIPVFGITVIEYPKACYMRRKFNAYIADHSDIYGTVEETESEENEFTMEDAASDEVNEQDKMGISEKDDPELRKNAEQVTDDMKVEQLETGKTEGEQPETERNAEKEQPETGKTEGEQPETERNAEKEQPETGKTEGEQPETEKNAEKEQPETGKTEGEQPETEKNAEKEQPETGKTEGEQPETERNAEREQSKSGKIEEQEEMNKKAGGQEETIEKEQSESGKLTNEKQKNAKKTSEKEVMEKSNGENKNNKSVKGNSNKKKKKKK